MELDQQKNATNQLNATKIVFLLKLVCSLYSGVHLSKGPPVMKLAAITWKHEAAGEIQAGTATEH
jgi:hypothetical protein